MKKIVLSLMFSVAFLLQQAHGIVFLEPYGGLGIGNGKAVNQERGNGLFFYGAKLGGKAPTFQAGILSERAKISNDEGGQTYIEDYNTTSFGVFMTASFGIITGGVQYFTYAQASGGSWVGINSNSSQTLFGPVELRDGSGYGFELGFTLLPYVNVNLYYRNYDFKHLRTSGTINGTSDSDSSLNFYAIGISFPYEII